jgi:hypothetical protein
VTLLTVIEQEDEIVLRIKNLQTIHNIFELQAHVIAVPITFIVGSNVEVLDKW